MNFRYHSSLPHTNWKPFLTDKFTISIITSIVTIIKKAAMPRLYRTYRNYFSEIWLLPDAMINGHPGGKQCVNIHYSGKCHTDRSCFAIKKKYIFLFHSLQIHLGTESDSGILCSAVLPFYIIYLNLLIPFGSIRGLYMSTTHPKSR